MEIAEPSANLKSIAGVYHVAFQLAIRGYHVAPTLGNATIVDILVGTTDGSAALSVQVKATWYALRTRGRGNNKRPYEYQWDVGEKLAKSNHPDLFFAFVDLKRMQNKPPDVFIVPSEVIYNDFKRWFKTGLKRWRWHPKIGEADKYKNAWKIIEDRMKDKSIQKE